MTACRQYGHCKNQNRSHEILPAADVDFDVNFLIRYSEGILVRGSHDAVLTFRFSGGALTSVPWHFLYHRPLQPVVSRWHSPLYHLRAGDQARSTHRPPRDV